MIEVLSEDGIVVDEKTLLIISVRYGLNKSLCAYM